MGRTTSVVAPDGASTTTYLYSGNTVTVTDAAGKWKTMTMDGAGNLVPVTEPRPAGGNYTTTYTYDVLSHLTGVSMPRDGSTQTRTFNYIDPATSQPGAFLRSATNPESGTVSYTYNGAGLVTTKTDANGNVLTYSYDGYNRLYQVLQGASVVRTFRLVGSNGKLRSTGC